MWIRHALAIAVLPFVAVVVVPRWILDTSRIFPGSTTPTSYGIRAIGVMLLVIGFAFFLASLRRFATEGRGTLAPWDPPRELVVNGPYRHVRNPMISGVVLFAFGEAAVLLSWPLLVWAAAFFALNTVYIPLVEEPQLRRRFGSIYDEYCRHVPRVIPRLRPWRPPRVPNRSR